MGEKNQRVDAKKQKIVVIVGPTASGKSALAVDIASRYTGEIVSADSRQVYRGLDIGTGKVTKEEMAGIPHHLLDIADPKTTYTVAMFIRDATLAVDGIFSRGKLPIIVGGTFFYIDTLIYGTPIPAVPPNEALRQKLEALDAETLYGALVRTDPNRARTIDRKNKRRLIRALEIVEALGIVPDVAVVPDTAPYTSLILGIDVPKDVLRESIRKRLRARMDAGMVDEVRRLHAAGLPYERMDALGLEYRYIAHLLEGRMTELEMLEKLETEIWHYAKRQRTWLRKKKDIVWIPKDKLGMAYSHIDAFLSES